MVPSCIVDASASLVLGAAAVSYDRSYYIGLALLLVAVVYAVVKARGVWAEINEEIEPDQPQDLLRSFEEAHAAGEIDDQELARVKARLAGGPTEGQPPPVPESPAPVKTSEISRSVHRIEGDDAP